jgi:prepilin peptidase CpaA
MTDVFSTALLPIMMMLAGIGDVLTYRIPNWLNGLIAALFFPVALYFGMSWEMIGIHAATGVALLVLGFTLFGFGVFGGGDAKLMAAAGLWFGWPAVTSFLVYTAFAGGALAVAVAVIASTHVELDIRGFKRLRAAIDSKPNVPYGLAFAIGAILAFRDTWWMALGA